MGLVVSIALGVAATLASHFLMPGPEPFRPIGAAAIGIAGAVGGYLVGTLLGGTLLGFDTRSLIFAVIGTLYMLFAYRSFALRYEPW